MKNLVRHIEYLLSRHDCVIVPGWGAWIVQYNPAAVEDHSSIAPPERWLSFNASLAHNDGLLAHSLMQAERCSYEEASSYIAAEVAAWQAALQQEGHVSLGKIGRFDRQETGIPLFAEASESVVNTPLSLLPAFSLPTLSEFLSDAPEPESEDDEPHQQEPLTWHSRLWQAAVSVAAIVILLLFISTPIDNYEVSNDYAGMVATEMFGLSAPTSAIVGGQQAVCSTDEPSARAIVETTVYTEPEQPDGTAEDSPETVEITTEQPVSTGTTTVLPRYILVIGSLPTRALAEKQIAHFHAIGVTEPIRIYEKEGKSRLYIEGYDSMSEAQARLNTLSRDASRPFEGIWICATR